jgi:serine/threonine protein kinase
MSVSVEIGQTISHYTILEKLGEGGMGVVYKALDTSLNRNVALKFLPTHLTKDNTSRKRFMVEAQAASALDHPNICNIHEISKTPDDQLYICMAYYEGESLSQKIKKGPIAFDEALNIIIRLHKV